jgi:PAS domain S-box-containing protein
MPLEPHSSSNNFTTNTQLLELNFILENIDRGFISVDRDWRITYINKRASEDIGQKKEYLIGKNLWSEIPHFEKLQAAKTFRKAMDEKVAVETEEFAPTSGRWFQEKAYPTPNGIAIAWADITERKKTEEKLRVSEERFAKAFNSSPIAIAISRQYDGLFIQVNGAYEEVFGFSREEIIGKTATQLNILIDSKQRNEMIKILKEKGRIIDVEIPFRTKSGKIINSLASLDTIKVDDEDYIISAILDISERKEAEEALRDSEARFSKVFHANPSAMAISNFDGRYVDVNHSFERLTGFLKDEAIGKTAIELNLYAQPSEREKLIVQLKQNGRVTGKELTLRTKSGELGNIIISFEPIAVKNENYILSIAIDITERKKAEQALKESEERFRLVAEAANVMVYETDVRTGKAIAYRGSEEVVGFKPEDVDFSVNWVSSRIHPDDVKNVLEQFTRVLKDSSHEGYTVKYRFLHKNGNYIILQDTAKAIRDNYGQVIKMIGGAVDITTSEKDKEKIEQYSKHLEDLVEKRTKQLKESERLAAIGQTAGMVGHDIRNPLQAITGDVFLLRDYLSGIPETISVKHDVSESLESIEQNISYINKIVADLQDYSRTVTPKLVDVNLYDTVIQCFRSIVIPENVSPSIEITESLRFQTDPDLFQRILTNLVINAMQAMPKGGKLSIVAAWKQNNLVFSVEDTGEGIPEHVKPKLFTPMMTTKAKGQGLGLAVVKRLVEALNGTITFESEEGKGTKFIIELPIIR